MNPSPRTLALLPLIADPALRGRVRALLHEPPVLMGPPTVPALERVHFAVIKLALEGERMFGVATALYRVDMRDLLMNAEFAVDVQAHEQWYARVVGRAE